jgi:cell wall-associated NlpC family hydrolase
MESSNIPAGQTYQDSGSIVLDLHQKDIIRRALVESARKLIGIPYVFGTEWTDYSQLPKALDCSELIEGVYHQNGLKMPDGSQNQFDFTVPTGNPQIGDLAFFGRGANVKQIYHVGMMFDKYEIIEARGYQSGSSFETGKVILRPTVKWENYANFTGYRAHPKLL